MDLQRYKLTVEYDGSLFSGWQKQKSGVHTVQGLLESKLCRFAKVPVTVMCAGRTDAGVHATGQVAHTDVPAKLSKEALFYGLNDKLRDQGVSVMNVEPVEEDFHARFSARWRRYQYRVLAGTAPSALRAKRVWFVRSQICQKRIEQALSFLLGHHDFKAFQSSGCSAKTTERVMRIAQVAAHEDEVHLTFESNAFLYHQVRNMVGVLVSVGSGRLDPDYVAKMLATGDVKMRVRCAPPSGLYLTKVLYEEA